LEAGIEPKNQRSIALAKAIGMVREGYSKKDFISEANGWTWFFL
jgi:RimJ/RimL family protein N-acetyltransferase